MALLLRASGIILTGGSSSRMGTDKALLAVGDPPMPLAARVGAALRDAGCPDVTCVGGDQGALTTLGLSVVPDDHPGEGPLGGVLTGLRVAALPTVVVLACDLPAIDGATIRGLLATLGSASSAQAAVPVVDGRLQVHALAVRRSARGALADAFAAGERSLTRALGELEVVTTDRLDPAALADVDRPADLGRAAPRRHPPRSTPAT